MSIEGHLQFAFDGKGIGEAESVRADLDDNGKWTVIRGGRHYLNIYAVTSHDEAGLRRLVDLAGENPNID